MAYLTSEGLETTLLGHTPRSIDTYIARDTQSARSVEHLYSGQGAYLLVGLFGGGDAYDTPPGVHGRLTLTAF